MAKTELPILLEENDEPVPADKLIEWRKRNGLRQWQAAEWFGVSYKTYENWEQKHQLKQIWPKSIRRRFNEPIPAKFRRHLKTLKSPYARKSDEKAS